jgi:hypothetical protein
MGKNKPILTPLELQYVNPLKARVGNKVTFDHEPDLKGINFEIEKMAIYKTVIKVGGHSKEFYHTDYHLRGVSLSVDKPMRFRLRLIPDPDITNALGSKVQILRLYDEMAWNEGLFNILNDASGQFIVNQDDHGVELTEPFTYWRIDGVLDPYHATVTSLIDRDGNGKIEEKEIEKHTVSYWDYHRDTEDPTTKQPYTEYLTIEMNNISRYFTFLRGTNVDAFQITVY